MRCFNYKAFQVIEVYYGNLNNASDSFMIKYDKYCIVGNFCEVEILPNFHES